MRLTVLVPTRTVAETRVRKVLAEAENGWFCLRPRHADLAAALVPGVLAFVDAGGAEGFLAVDEGTLVKVGPEVLVAVRRAVRGPDLESLRDTVDREFRRLDERERVARSALARLEAQVVRRFLEQEPRP